MPNQGTQPARDDEVVINEQLSDKASNPSLEGQVTEPAPVDNDIKPIVLTTAPDQPRRRWGSSSIL